MQIREDDLDVLLRGKVLADLYSVVRQGLRVSEESYSLMKIEKLYGMGREGPVTHPGFALVAYEEWLESGRAEILDEMQRIERLRTGIPAAAAERTDGQRARWLLSNLVDFHCREEKPQWWRYFDLVKRPMEELIAASDALAWRPAGR
jgi:hypothetical protein